MSKPTLHNGKWRIRYFDENGIRRSQVFEKLSDAESELAYCEQQVRRIKSGIEAPRPESEITKKLSEKTFEDLCNYWLNNLACNKRSKQDDKCIIDRHLIPFFRNSRLSKITFESVVQYKNDKSFLSPKTVSIPMLLLL